MCLSCALIFNVCVNLSLQVNTDRDSDDVFVDVSAELDKFMRPSSKPVSEQFNGSSIVAVVFHNVGQLILSQIDCNMF